MKYTLLLLSLFTIAFGCSKNPKDSKSSEVTDELVNGELSEIAKERGLKSEDLLSAVKTYNPSGAQDEFLAFFGTGVSGRLAVVGMPSMKILKYVAVFSAEPWQGYAFDDESKNIIKGSARDEIEYSFGDMGAPALSLTGAKHDARAVFFADAANGRIGMVDLAEYETKQIVSHPLFKNSNADISVSSDTRYVSQTLAQPEMLKSENKKTSAASFWRFIGKGSEDQKHFFIDPSTSFTVLLPAGPQSSPAMGKMDTDGLMLSISTEERPQLNVINWKVAESVLATKSVKLNNHLTFRLETALNQKILQRFELPSGSDRVIVSGNGKYAAITNNKNSTVHVLELKSLKSGKLNLRSIEVGGPSADANFTNGKLFVTVHGPNQVVAIGLDEMSVKSIHRIDFPAGKIMIPGADTSTPSEEYAIITNHSPYGRYTGVGPQSGLSAHLLDIKGDTIRSLYDASIPQSTRLGAVAMSTKINKPIFKYKIGTDPRTGLISNYKTPSGKEKIIRHGKRVHVYATVIRSHITPDTIEVEQGDIVSIHITSNEQSRDQTHGFTIDTYNVHGSWEPGKTATVTFTADRAGVFPYYCTEFCSALHLEMQGYLLVKPAKVKVADNDNLLKLHNNPKMKSFFKYIKGE